MREAHFSKGAVLAAIDSRYWSQVSGKIKKLAFYDKAGNEVDVNEVRVSIQEFSDIYKQGKG